MKVLLDTNAYSEFKRGRQPLIDYLERVEEIFIPATVYGELCAGFYQGSKTKRNLDELSEFLDLPGVALLEISRDVADRYGQLMKMLLQNGSPLPTNDVWIAAATLESGARLVSYDRHFDRVSGLSVVSP